MVQYQNVEDTHVFVYWLVPFLHLLPCTGSRVFVLPNQTLQISWEPSDDAGRSIIDYIVNTTTTGIDFNNFTSVNHTVSSVSITGLPQYSVGTVSVWAKNLGALSEPAISRFRMVNIVTRGRHNYST